MNKKTKKKRIVISQFALGTNVRVPYDRFLKKDHEI